MHADLFMLMYIYFQLDTLKFTETTYEVSEGDKNVSLTLQFSKPLPKMTMVKFQYNNHSACGK